ncbi:hypothetical protein K1X76_10065 [bacterium]|nr:hypothetical protein [bacterium]
MIKSYFRYFILFIFLTPASSVFGITATELYQQCKLEEKVNAKNPSENSLSLIQDMVAVNRCYSYIQGVVDGFRLDQDTFGTLLAMNKQTDAELIAIGKVIPRMFLSTCLPNAGVQNEDIVSAVKDMYLSDKTWAAEGQTGRQLVFMAVEKKYPCGVKK